MPCFLMLDILTQHKNLNFSNDFVFAMAISLVNVPICKAFEALYIMAGTAYAAHVRYEVEAEMTLKLKGVKFLSKVRMKIKKERCRGLSPTSRRLFSRSRKKLGKGPQSANHRPKYKRRSQKARQCVFPTCEKITRSYFHIKRQLTKIL